MKIKYKELLGKPSESEVSSDSDQELKKNPIGSSSLAPPLPRDEAQARSRELARIISAINALLDKEQPIDLSNYSPLYIVHYRGVNFFTQFFTQSARREERKRIKDKKRSSIYAPAVYESAGLKLGQVLSTTERIKLHSAHSKLKMEFIKLRKSKPKKKRASFGNQRSHETEAHRHYQRYINNYEEFRDESKKKDEPTYQILSATDNPYISTANDPRHAVFYALGGKAELSHGVLRPTYMTTGDQKGRAKHPKVGYVHILFHTLDSFSRNEPFLLSSLHAADAIDIKNRILNERETTFIGKIAHQHIVHTKIVRFPSFNKEHPSSYYKFKYGLERPGVYKKNISNETSDAQETNLLEKLAIYYIEKIRQKAEDIARIRGGFIVYLGLDGRLSSSLPTTLDVTTERSSLNATLLADLERNLALFHCENLENSESDLEDYFDIFEEGSIPMPGLEKPLEELTISDVFLPEGLRLQHVPGDGHCLYNAVGLYLGRSQEALRAEVADYIEAHADEAEFSEILNAFIPQGSTIHDYVHAIRGSEWADNLEIDILSRIYNRPIIVVDPNGDIRNRDTLEVAGEPIFVYYNGHNHYDGLVNTGNRSGIEILTEINTGSAAQNVSDAPTASPRVLLFGNGHRQSVPALMNRADSEEEDLTARESRKRANSAP